MDNPKPEAFAPMTKAELANWTKARLVRIVAEEFALVRQRLTVLEQKGARDV